MIGTGGRARLTFIALDPLSVNATRNFAPISRAVFTAPRAIAKDSDSAAFARIV